MKIGNLPQRGEQSQLGKWYWGFEIAKCPPYMVRLFKPYIAITLVKVNHYGTTIAFMDRFGGRKEFIFPWGISIEIHR